MDLSSTLIGLVISAAVFGWANWQQRREREPSDVSLIPFTLIQMVGVVAIVVMAGHLISLLTGVPFRGRMG
jgi:uncharacterized membrane protein YidH (DUF202 family)